MSTKIIQVDIGEGTQWGEDLARSVIRDICIPSVKSYANKFGYDYELLTSSTYKEKIGSFDFLMKESKHYAFERYLHLDSAYDYLVYIDNDIYISESAERLPDIHGLMATAEPGNTNSKNMFVQLNNLNPSTHYINSGMFMADKDSAKQLGDYMIYRAKNYLRAKGKSTDNMMFNEYIISDLNPTFSELGEKWNYMPMLPGSTVGLSANFMHLVGIDGKAFLTQLNEINAPMTELLEMITTGKIKIKSPPN